MGGCVVTNDAPSFSSITQKQFVIFRFNMLQIPLIHGFLIPKKIRCKVAKEFNSPVYALLFLLRTLSFRLKVIARKEKREYAI